jgi:hypothetical protein
MTEDDVPEEYQMGVCEEDDIADEQKDFVELGNSHDRYSSLISSLKNRHEQNTIIE